MMSTECYSSYCITPHLTVLDARSLLICIEHGCSTANHSHPLLTL